MSYVRWSTKVRKDCKTCGDTGYVEPDKWAREMEMERSLCRDCNSCWYVFGHTNGMVAAYHATCPGNHDDPESPLLHLDPEAALEWEPPDGCPMADVGRDAVRECARDMLDEDTAQRPSQEVLDLGGPTCPT